MGRRNHFPWGGQDAASVWATASRLDEAQAPSGASTCRTPSAPTCLPKAIQLRNWLAFGGPPLAESAIAFRVWTKRRNKKRSGGERSPRKGEEKIGAKKQRRDRRGDAGRRNDDEEPERYGSKRNTGERGDPGGQDRNRNLPAHTHGRIGGAFARTRARGCKRPRQRTSGRHEPVRPRSPRRPPVSATIGSPTAGAPYLRSACLPAHCSKGI